MWEARQEVKPKYLGDDMVLLVGLNNTRAEELCNTEEDNKMSLFHSLEKWNPGLQIGYRLVWILCWGVPCVGRKYTWYRPNGTAKSILDRFLVSVDWFNKWKDNSQFILQRNFSYHCPILLRSSNVDWGSKPFRVLDCWFQDEQFRKVVCDWWTSHSIQGWGGYVLKEKMKGLKQRLKVWNKEQFGDIQKKISRIELELNMLEVDGVGRQLSDREIELRKKLQEELWVATTSYESLLRQKARTKWIKERDCISKFFHITVNGNRKHNSLRGLWVDGCWTEEPIRIKEEVSGLMDSGGFL